MAIQRLSIDGYGQLELNQVTFRRDGRIEAQCALSADDFSKEKPAENGMILAIDQVAREVKLPGDNDVLYGLNYTTEHMYDDRANALKDFALEPGTFYPRLGILTIGDKFTTNTVAYDTANFADDDAFVEAVEDVKTTPLYGGVDASGAIAVSATKPASGPVLNVVKATTMPNGTFGIKFQVIG